MPEEKYYNKLVEVHKEMGDIKGMLNGLITSVSDGFKNSEKCDNEIIEHQKETNGRVKKLEKETHVTRWFHRNPKATLTMSIIVAALLGLSIISWITPDKGKFDDEEIKKMTYELVKKKLGL